MTLLHIRECLLYYAMLLLFFKDALAIFYDMNEKFLEIFMNEFTLYGSTYEAHLHNLSLVLQRCEETNLVLNWKKCHFIVKEGNVLDHKVSSKGIVIDQAKMDVIERLPIPTSLKEVQSFLSHVDYYSRFIKNFSKISKPLSNLLKKDVKFDLYDKCLHAFQVLKEKFIITPMIVNPYWSLLFELMCDTIIGVVLGQRKDKVFHTINYASWILNAA